MGCNLQLILVFVWYLVISANSLLFFFSVESKNNEKRKQSQWLLTALLSQRNRLVQLGKTNQTIRYSCMEVVVILL